jgi:hypothetical protein
MVANDECDVFLMSKTYMSYIWDQMKQFKSNIVADMLQMTNGFT